MTYSTGFGILGTHYNPNGSSGFGGIDRPKTTSLHTHHLASTNNVYQKYLKIAQGGGKLQLLGKLNRKAA